jgi:hypothetical protein
VGFGSRLVDAEIGERARAVLEFCRASRMCSVLM